MFPEEEMPAPTGQPLPSAPLTQSTQESGASETKLPSAPGRLGKPLCFSVRPIFPQRSSPEKACGHRCIASPFRQTAPEQSLGQQRSALGETVLLGKGSNILSLGQTESAGPTFRHLNGSPWTSRHRPSSEERVTAKGKSMDFWSGAPESGLYSALITHGTLGKLASPDSHVSRLWHDTMSYLSHKTIARSPQDYAREIFHILLSTEQAPGHVGLFCLKFSYRHFKL